MFLKFCIHLRRHLCRSLDSDLNPDIDRRLDRLSFDKLCMHLHDEKLPRSNAALFQPIIGTLALGFFTLTSGF